MGWYISVKLRDRPPGEVGAQEGQAKRLAGQEREGCGPRAHIGSGIFQ